VPALTGLGAPDWDPHARGLVIGITRGTTRAHLVRATLEAIAYQCRDVVDVMTRESGHSIKEMRVDGGASGNDFLMQFQSDILGVRVNRPVQVETTAVGAAFLAGMGVGFWKGTQELVAARRVDRTFSPEMPEDRRQKLYDGWKAAVARTLSSR